MGEREECYGTHPDYRWAIMGMLGNVVETMCCQTSGDERKSIQNRASMTYAASLTRQQLIRHLGGNCRLNLQTGAILSMDGDRRDSCAVCPASCMGGGKHATGMAGDSLPMLVEDTGGGNAKLSWKCPGCGIDTCEHASILSIMAVAKEVENDPLCVTCRRHG